MHFHLPKPLHGWREFVGEVGIIVLGVGIALGAEQLVESWQWHRKVAVVRKSIMSELANDRARWEVNITEAGCDLHEIDRVNRAVQNSAAGKPLPKDNLQNFFWMNSANWGLATSSQALEHFPVDQQLAFATLYDGISHRQVDIEKADDLMGRVSALVPFATDAQGRRELGTALASLKLQIGIFIYNNAYIRRHFDAVGVKPDRTDLGPEIGGSNCAS